jgi:hypothetical protein
MGIILVLKLFMRLSTMFKNWRPLTQFLILIIFILVLKLLIRIVNVYQEDWIVPNPMIPTIGCIVTKYAIGSFLVTVDAVTYSISVSELSDIRPCPPASTESFSFFLAGAREIAAPPGGRRKIWIWVRSGQRRWPFQPSKLIEHAQENPVRSAVLPDLIDYTKYTSGFQTSYIGHPGSPLTTLITCQPLITDLDCTAVSKLYPGGTDLEYSFPEANLGQWLSIDRQVREAVAKRRRS